MKLDLSCPIEVRGYALTCSERGLQAEVRLYNLSGRSIESFEAVARWHSSSENRKIVCPFSMERVHACGRNMFRITLDNNRLPGADSLEILFNTIRFEDGDSEWRAGSGPFAEMEPLPPMSEHEKNMLRTVAGSDAVCYPKQDAQTWRCVCGRLNPNGADACVRCRRDHFSALGFTPENVQFHYENDHTAPAETAEPLPVLERRFVRRRARLFQQTLLIALAALAVTVLLVVREQPAANTGALTASATAIETVSFKN